MTLRAEEGENMSIVSYAILKSFHSDSKDLLTAYIPFVEWAIELIGKTHFTISEVSEKIKTETEIFIPVLTLKTLLKRMAKDDGISIFSDNNGNSWYQVNDEYSKIHSSYKQTYDTYQRNINKLILAFKRFGNIDKSDEEVLKFIGDFILISFKFTDLINENKENTILTNDEFIIMSDFLKHIKRYENELFQTFVDIYYGFILSQINKPEDIEKYKRKMKSINIYIDSNYLLRLLQFQSEEEYNASFETLNVLKNFGFNIIAPIEIVEEARDVLQKKYNQMVKQRGAFEVDQRYANRIGGVTGGIIRRKLRHDQLEDEIRDFERKIENVLSIKIDRSKLISSEIISDNELNELYDIKLKKFLSKYSLDDVEKDLLEGDEEVKKDEDVPDWLKTNIRKKALLDIKIIQFIKKQRQNHDIYYFEEAKSLFLTCDKVFYYYNKRKCKKAQITHIFLEDVLLNTLWLFDSQKTGSNAEISRIIAMFQSSKYLHMSTLHNFLSILREHIDKNPDQLSRFDLILSNQYTYSKLKELDYNNDQASISELIKELSQSAEEELKKILDTVKKEVTDKQKAEIQPIIESAKELEVANKQKTEEIDELVGKLSSTEKVVRQFSGVIIAFTVLTAILLDTIYYLVFSKNINELVMNVLKQEKLGTNKFLLLFIFSIGVFILIFEYYAISNLIKLVRVGKIPQKIDIGKWVVISLSISIASYIIPLFINMLSSIM
ncbi:hypothetical protein [Treponema pedis]|uniref:hypothetical protein n=2 Tax=Treponema pedis TaxID=409322 RepID=UPI001268CB57|nr:hypothetical protein [Treponema pedis]